VSLALIFATPNQQMKTAPSIRCLYKNTFLPSSHLWPPVALWVKKSWGDRGGRKLQFSHR